MCVTAGEPELQNCKLVDLYLYICQASLQSPSLSHSLIFLALLTSSSSAMRLRRWFTCLQLAKVLSLQSAIASERFWLCLQPGAQTPTCSGLATVWVPTFLLGCNHSCSCLCLPWHAQMTPSVPSCFASTSASSFSGSYTLRQGRKVLVFKE